MKDVVNSENTCAMFSLVATYRSMNKQTDCDSCFGTGKKVDHKALGRSMSGLRLRTGLSLYDVAPRMGVSVGFLCNLESGRRKWTPEWRNKYLEGIGVKGGNHS